MSFRIVTLAVRIWPAGFLVCQLPLTYDATTLNSFFPTRKFDSDPPSDILSLPYDVGFVHHQPLPAWCHGPPHTQFGVFFPLFALESCALV